MNDEKKDMIKYLSVYYKEMTTAAETVFKASKIPWEGFGLNCKVDDIATISNQIVNLNSQWTRFFLEIEDPGVDGIYYDDDTFDRAWEASENIQSQATRFAFATFETTGSKFIFTSRTAPASWLTKDGTNELRGDALVAFARMFVSGIITHKKFGMAVEWVEICDEPSTPNGTFITPENYVILVSSFKSILQARMQLEPNLIADVKVMGPGLSCIVPKFQPNEPYIRAFEGSENLLDAWSVHVLENDVDSHFYNMSNFDARNYVKNQLTQTIRFMNWTLPGLHVYITKFATNATKFSTGIDYGKGAPETVEYGMRLMDNVCGIVSSGASSALSWYLTFRHDNKALYRNDGSKRPQRDALSLLNKALPTNGTIYMPQDETSGNPDDQTLKAFVASRNSFGFILSRPHQKDMKSGSLQLKIENSEWKTLKFKSTMSLYCFPGYVSLSGVEKIVTIENGVMTIKFTELPYNCVIYGKGDVYNAPPLLLPPMQKMQVTIPRVTDVTNLTTINERDVIYDTQKKTFAIYINGKFVPCQIHSGLPATMNT